MDPRVSSYHRLVRSALAEQILSDCKIHVNVDTLRPMLLRVDKSVKKSSDIYKYMKNASQGNGFVQTAYHSKTIKTARMFTKKNHLNLITLNDPLVLKSIDSRYEGGKIVVLDYKNYEPSIIRGLLPDIFPEDLHSWASELLGVSRNDVKQINMNILYGEYSENLINKIADKLQDLGCISERIIMYLEDMETVKSKIDEYSKPLLEQYQQHGCAINSYGRKIYPKNESNIFSNTIQSIGSEILIESIIALSDQLSDKDAHILFHRFDALYIDMSREALFSHLSSIIKTMETVGGSADLKVGIQIGDNLASLKELDSG